MAGCTPENWSLQELSSALQDTHKDHKKIVVPMFQRGSGRWGKEQERTFIDSLIKGYPVGTMLFYKTVENNIETYILVDGLQRGNCIRKYMNNPTEFFYDSSISDDFCKNVLKIVKRNNEEDYHIIRTLLTDFIKKQKTFKNLQYYNPAKEIAEKFGAGYECIGDLITTITDFFEERQDLYDSIANTIIPVIVYSGDEATLPEIFDRINSKGTPLDKYEIYAAAWPINEKYTISNTRIVEYVIAKYDAFVSDGYKIHGYNRENMRVTKKVTAFEYLFGLSKFLVYKYKILGFNRNLSSDTVNPLAYELVNACLNDSDKIKTLYMRLRDINLDELESALCKAIEFVNNAISVVTKFKGNSRNTNKIFHSKYQILSMISTTFKEMYAEGDFSIVSTTWNDRKNIIARNLIHYYVYDILTNYWSEGGTGKIHAAAKPNRYMNEISSRAWMAALDSFFEKSMLRSEKKSFANPKNEELVFLNCIYLKTFTAMDQLSIEKFDVEHIAPKEQMRRLIETCDGEGLPVSCIANLCYLPEYVNRSKKDKNFYQDKKYLLHVKLKDVETKYSFTEQEDLDWMDIPYEKNDFSVLKEYYTDFCTKRFEKIKHLFCASMEIEYEDIVNEEPEIVQKVVSPSKNKESNKRVKFADKCVIKLAQEMNCELVKVGRSTYISTDGSKGYVITTSKAYRQGNREKYWFAYRRNPLGDLKKCKEKYVVYGCKDENTMICLPVSEIEKSLDRLNLSTDEDGMITHWHMVFFKDSAGIVTWMLSRPEIEEINVNKYVI